MRCVTVRDPARRRMKICLRGRSRRNRPALGIVFRRPRASSTNFIGAVNEHKKEAGEWEDLYRHDDEIFIGIQTNFRHKSWACGCQGISQKSATNALSSGINLATLQGWLFNLHHKHFGSPFLTLSKCVSRVFFWFFFLFLNPSARSSFILLYPAIKKRVQSNERIIRFSFQRETEVC